MNTLLIFSIIAFSLIGCAEKEDQPLGQENPEATPLIQDESISVSTGSVVYDTVRVVYYDTLRTIQYDTIRTVLRDTIRTEISVTSYDTILVAFTPSVPGSDQPRSVKELTAQQIAVMQDSLRTGVMIKDAFTLVTSGVPAYATVSASQLDTVQLDLIATAFETQINRVRQFRWGFYSVPKGTKLNNHKFLTLWLGNGEDQVELVKTMSPSGVLAIKADESN